MDQVERARDLFFKGLDCLESREFESAERFFFEALKFTPRSIAALNNLAISQFEQNKITDAATTAQKVNEIDSKNIDALFMLSACQSSSGRYEEAIISCQKIIDIDPSFAQAHCNLGCALKQVGSYREAIESFNRAIALDAQFADAFLNRGNAFRGLKLYEEALSSYGEALELKPDLAEAWFGRGSTLSSVRRYDEAFECLHEAQRTTPEFYDAHFMEAVYRLLLGDYERGWKKYEARWGSTLSDAGKRRYSQPLWLGDSSIAKKTILLHAEQGLGDTIMASRYVPLVSALGAKVILVVPPSLKVLLRSLEGVSTLIEVGETIPDFDLQCPLMSLPLAFKTRLDTIPAVVPYLTADVETIRKWKSRLDGNEFKVGVAWAGNPSFRDDRERSILLKNIFPLFGVPGVKFFSIQKDLRPGDEEILNANPQLVHLGSETAGFHDDAGVMMSLDLIISSDTAVVHLAGALARPVWVLLSYNPEWRWMLERNDSPWYPTARLFRQKKDGDWVSVIDSVCEELKRELGPRLSGH
jgi:tetratricopeptide (TPR) repeat protein